MLGTANSKLVKRLESLDKFKHSRFWTNISQIFLSEAFMEKFLPRLCILNISQHQKLSYKFIYKYRSYLYASSLYRNKNINKKFKTAIYRYYTIYPACADKVSICFALRSIGEEISE